jgi:hypothetical protein
LHKTYAVDLVGIELTEPGGYEIVIGPAPCGSGDIISLSFPELLYFPLIVMALAYGAHLRPPMLSYRIYNTRTNGWGHMGKSYIPVYLSYHPL